MIRQRFAVKNVDPITNNTTYSIYEKLSVVVEEKKVSKLVTLSVTCILPDWIFYSEHELSRILSV